MPYKRIEDKRACRNRYYHNHIPQERQQKYARKAEIDKWFKEFKSHCYCAECGESHPATLDFHHVNPKEKKHNIHKMVKNAMSKESIKEELAKTICLCSNCHRKLHWKG